MCSTGPRVSVLGLGLMGTAIARTLVRNGCAVTVWNRSAERTRGWEETATVASSVAAACRASDIIVVSLLDAVACCTVLRNPETAAALESRLLVQLTTTTPSDACDEAAWAASCGARYLAGAILGPPDTVGADPSRIFVSGQRDAFDDARAVLETLAPSTCYLGEEIGRAATMDHALLELTYGSLALLFHAMALCEAGSVPLDVFLGHIRIFAEGFVTQRAGGILSGSYPPPHATMHVFAAWSAQLVETARSLGVDPALPTALQDGIERTVALGHGNDDYQTLFETFRRRGA